MGIKLENLAKVSNYEGDLNDHVSLIVAIDHATDYKALMNEIQQINLDEDSTAFISAISEQLSNQMKDVDLLTMSDETLRQLFWKISLLVKSPDASLEILALYPTVEVLLNLQLSINPLSLPQDHENLALFNSRLFGLVIKSIIDNKASDYRVARGVIERANASNEFNFKNIRPDLVYQTLSILAKRSELLEGLENELYFLRDVFGMPEKMTDPDSYHEFENHVTISRVHEKLQPVILPSYAQSTTRDAERNEISAQEIAIQTLKNKNNQVFLDAIIAGHGNYAKEKGKSAVSDKKSKFIELIDPNNPEQTVIAFFQYLISRYDDYGTDRLSKNIMDLLNKSGSCYQNGAASRDEKILSFPQKMIVAFTESLNQLPPIPNLDHMDRLCNCFEILRKYFPYQNLDFLFSGKDVPKTFLTKVMIPYLNTDSAINGKVAKLLSLASTHGNFSALKIDRSVINKQAVIDEFNRLVGSCMENFKKLSDAYVTSTGMLSRIMGDGADKSLKLYLKKMTAANVPDDSLHLRFVLIMLRLERYPSFCETLVSNIKGNTVLMPYLESYGVKKYEFYQSRPTYTYRGDDEYEERRASIYRHPQQVNYYSYRTHVDNANASGRYPNLNHNGSGSSSRNAAQQESAGYTSFTGLYKKIQ